jgi:penicillin amidase
MAIFESLRQRLGALPLAGLAKTARWAAIAAMAGMLIVAAAVGWLIYSSLPTRSGTLDVDGLSAPIEIARDPRGVPHIFAANLDDATFALGFVHAQDRLWQMEAMRRFASGRLSEVAGARTLSSDRMMRTLGFERLVEKQFAALSDDARRALSRYAEGVNAWLLEHRGALPPEFQVLNFTPEPWRETDSLLWIKMMAIRLSGNFRDEIARSRLAERIGRERTDAFWYPDITPVQAAATEPPGGGGRTADISLEPRVAEAMLDALDALGELGAAPIGASNAWAVTGRFSGTGNAILANDPHLGYSMPGLWYLVRVSTPEGVRVGATAPGVPFLILGHNGRMAWGLTTTQTDQQDVFIERVGDDPSTHLTPSGFQTFETRREIIAVDGGADEEIVIRSTERGPVISDVLDAADVQAVDPDADAVLTLRAAFLDDVDTTPEALYRMNRAETMAAFETALSLVHAPQQNVVFASSDGEIGFVAAGAVPIRGGRNGRYPARGWALDDQWRGYVPFDELPRAVNPPGNRIVTANNRIVGPDYPYFITDDWAPPYRARRIFEIMGNRPQSPDTTAEAQRDSRSLMAMELLPYILDVDSTSPRVRAAQVLLQGWNGDMIRRRPEPLIFYAWLRRLNQLIYADDLGPLFERYWGLRPRFVLRVLTRDRVWCDDIGTDARETCSQLVARALTDSLAELTEAHESGIVRWRWGDDHHARFKHPLFSGIPLIGRLADRRIDADGGSYTVNRAAVRIRDSERPFDAVHGPGFRAIYDMGDLNRSRFMIATGQSGHLFSNAYGNLLTDWRNGLYFRLDLPRAVLHGADKTRTLTLIPTGVATRFRGVDAPDPQNIGDPAPSPVPAPDVQTAPGGDAAPLALPDPDTADEPEAFGDPLSAPVTDPGVAPPADPALDLMPPAGTADDLLGDPVIEGDPFEPAPEPAPAPAPAPAAEPALPGEEDGLFDLPGDEADIEPAPGSDPGEDLPGDALFGTPLDGMADEPADAPSADPAPAPASEPEPLPEADALPGAVTPPPTPIDPSNVDEIEESINDLMRSITESLDPLQE